MTKRRRNKDSRERRARRSSFVIRHSSFDVLGLGCCAVDEILYVDAWPPADVETRVLRRERHCGGLTATALVAAARLGGRCAYAGVLGKDADSEFVLDCLKREGIDVSHAIRRRGARPVRSVIVVDEHRRTRNIFYDSEGVAGADAHAPSKQLIASVRVLFVDRFGIPGMIRAARIAKAAGIPVVSDWENVEVPRARELMRLVDHFIVAEDFALRLTGTDHPATAVSALQSAGHKVAVVTCGERGCWFHVQGWLLPRYHPAFKVEAVDTTGCGDVFHGAYAFALAQGMPSLERIRLASAVAALKATRHGGQEGIPTLAVARRFLRRG
jgi:sugar/nucleoside kinase (ribokinase family)